MAKSGKPLLPVPARGRAHPGPSGRLRPGGGKQPAPPTLGGHLGLARGDGIGGFAGEILITCHPDRWIGIEQPSMALIGSPFGRRAAIQAPGFRCRQHIHDVSTTGPA